MMNASDVTTKESTKLSIVQELQRNMTNLN